MSGYARIYKEVDGSWVQVGRDLYDFSGYNVAMSADGMRVVVGDPNANKNGYYSGHARIYKEVDESWVQVERDLGGEAEEDTTGYSVAISADGMRVVVGAPGNNGNNGDYSGHARIYKEVDGSWVHVGRDLDGEAEGDSSGHSVAMSADGMRVVVGAPGNGYYSGHARIYKEVDGSWVQVGRDLDGEGTQDTLVHSVAMSADGMRVVVGAPGNNNEDYSGHARICEEVDGSLVQVGIDLDGEAEEDSSGHSVAMSADGKRAIVLAGSSSPSSPPSSSAVPAPAPSSSAISWSVNTKHTLIVLFSAFSFWFI